MQTPVRTRVLDKDEVDELFSAGETALHIEAGMRKAYLAASGSRATAPIQYDVGSPISNSWNMSRRVWREPKKPSGHSPSTDQVVPRRFRKAPKCYTMSIPPRVLGAFQIIPQQAPIRDFHGPWNKLLNYLFPPDSPYTVIPREYYPVMATKEQSGLKDIDAQNQPQLWFIKFEIQYEGLPVLLVLVSAPTVIESPLARKLADAEARKQMATLIELCPLPTMRAASAFGRHLCTYSCATTSSDAKINPPIVDEPGNNTEDVAPRERWSIDFLTPEGQKIVLEDVKAIKDECKVEDEAQN